MKYGSSAGSPTKRGPDRRVPVDGIQDLKELSVGERTPAEERSLYNCIFIQFKPVFGKRKEGEDALSAAGGWRLGWWLKFPLGIVEPAVEFEHGFRISSFGHGDLNGGKFVVPLVDLDAADVLFRPRLIVDPDVSIGMEEEQRLFPIGSRPSKRNQESFEFVLRLTRFDSEWICLAPNHGGAHVAHGRTAEHLFDPGRVLRQAKGPFRDVVDAPARQVNADKDNALPDKCKILGALRRPLGLPRRVKAFLESGIILLPPFPPLDGIFQIVPFIVTHHNPGWNGIAVGKQVCRPMILRLGWHYAGPWGFGLARLGRQARGAVLRLFYFWRSKHIAEMHHKLRDALAVFLLDVKGDGRFVWGRVRAAAHRGEYERLAGGGSREA